MRILLGQNVIKYIRENNTQEKIAFWDETQIRGIVKNWRIEKLEAAKKQQNKEPSNRIEENKIEEPESNYNQEQKDENKTEKTQKERKKAKQKVLSFKGDFRLKLEKIIDDNPDFYQLFELFNKYFN